MIRVKFLFCSSNIPAKWTSYSSLIHQGVLDIPDKASWFIAIIIASLLQTLEKQTPIYTTYFGESEHAVGGK